MSSDGGGWEKQEIDPKERHPWSRSGVLGRPVHHSVTGDCGRAGQCPSPHHPLVRLDEVWLAEKSGGAVKGLTASIPAPVAFRLPEFVF